MPIGVVMEKATPMAAALMADSPESTAALPMAKPSNSCSGERGSGGAVQGSAALPCDRSGFVYLQQDHTGSSRVRPAAGATEAHAALPAPHLVQRQRDQQGGECRASGHPQRHPDHQGMEDDARLSHVEANDLGGGEGKASLVSKQGTTGEAGKAALVRQGGTTGRRPRSCPHDDEPVQHMAITSAIGRPGGAAQVPRLSEQT